jgi:hypothetical protein
MKLRSQLHALATLTTVKEHVVPNRRPDGSQSQSEHFEKNLLVAGGNWRMIPQSSRL